MIELYEPKSNSKWNSMHFLPSLSLHPSLPSLPLPRSTHPSLKSIGSSLNPNRGPAPPEPSRN